SFLTSSRPSHFKFRSFPTRRSSDLVSCSFDLPGGTRRLGMADARGGGSELHLAHPRARTPHALGGAGCRAAVAREAAVRGGPGRDRKSTRLNSSHVKISYAVFCLKK